MTSSTTEDNERATDFVNFHGFTTRRAFKVREREDFVLGRMGKSERKFKNFAKELLAAIFIMVVFVDRKPHFGQEDVGLFISWNLIWVRVVGGSPI